MRTHLIVLNPEPIDLPFDATWQSWLSGHVTRAVVRTNNPERLRLRFLKVASDGVVAGPLAEQPAYLVMMDVDSILTTTEVTDLLAEYADTGELVTSITERAVRGESDLAESLWERVATLQDPLVRISDEVLPRITLSPGVWELATVPYEAEVPVGITSGGFTTFVAPLVGGLGLDFFNANELEVRDRTFMSRAVGTVVDRDQRIRDLIRFIVTSQVPLEHAVAVGDGANDLDMLTAARLDVVYRAKPVTATRADAATNFP